MSSRFRANFPKVDKTPGAGHFLSDDPVARLSTGPVPVAEDLTQIDSLPIVGKKSLYDGMSARNADGTFLYRCYFRMSAGRNSTSSDVAFPVTISTVTSRRKLPSGCRIASRCFPTGSSGSSKRPSASVTA